jgi:hypothetical protein
MAKVTRLPSQAVIDSFKGVLDFYVYLGVPCVRSWPRRVGTDRSPAVKAQYPNFTSASRSWSQMSQHIHDAYNSLASDSGISGRDLSIASMISGIDDTTVPPP